MGTCKECKHWAGNNRYHGMTFEMIQEDNSAFGCRKAAEFRDDEDRVFSLEPGDRFISDDGIGVLTGPDFGCIHFEPIAVPLKTLAEGVKSDADDPSWPKITPPAAE